MPAGALRGRSHAVEVDRRGGVAARLNRIACAAVEVLGAARRQQRQHARGRRGDEERVRDAARRHREAAGGDGVIGAVDVHEQFAVEHVQRLVGLVRVQRRRLALPNTRALLVATYPHIEQRSLLGADAPVDPQARLAAVVDDHMRRIVTFEPEQRTVLRLSLEPGGSAAPALPMHRGLRIGWIEDALAPLGGRIAPDELHRLVLGIGATIGIEAFVWLTDIAKLPREEAVAIMRSNALALLRAALADGEGASFGALRPHADDGNRA